MPKGLPTAAQLLGREITIFSIDTSVFQALGFKFEAGALHTLKLQRPDWMHLHLPDVVEREVNAHRIQPVVDAVRQFNTATKNVARTSSIDMTAIDAAASALKVVDIAKAKFETELRRFVAELGGSVLPVAGAALATEMFDRYFAEAPPFESKKEKKFEFPDAAALLLLEEYARTHNTKGILISSDNGWEAFANQSDRLFCVKSLEDFTGLFQSSGPAADTVKAKIMSAISNPTSQLSLMVGGALKPHLDRSTFVVDDIYTSGPHRVDADVAGVDVLGFDATAEPRVWFAANDPSMCIVELSLEVDVDAEVSYEVFAWDSIDGEEVGLGSATTSAEGRFDVDLFLTCEADFEDAIEDWDIEPEIAEGRYYLEVGEVDLFDDDYDRDEE